ncbi:hypothetical protein P154DRAFT_518781 [Amniculicola lignicola CBS 123094]|uniref:Exonuclease domain-containing protein n=1 Tax=Amniculicola lignicola CBS 123094 TaxID=1392246 RepID=A0A6A5X2C8_9PLEO|nr:hypothetical protein P154DRAFT_518781 [Amniculicola lignicola CBS 123094]
MDDDAQANDICMKMRRLLLQADLTISLEGYITYGGGDWKRVPVVKQQELYGQFSALCHLPEHLQLTEHLPSVTAFSLSDADYPFEEFQLSPKKSQSHRTVPIVAISCIKVTLMDSCEDVVKIAALDVTTGRVLMHYFVCTNTEAAVKDWRVSTTGMESFDDMERFRQLGYKVLRGWSAARATLWQFIDNESILVGHDLRNDLDALRMIHGRGVDVAKSVELAANGPLSKQQLSLDSLSRDILKQPLVSHPSGRDALLDAFAIRELALHIIKNAGGIKAWARGQSLAYQRVVPTARA